jgi:hypothetical protein
MTKDDLAKLEQDVESLHTLRQHPGWEVLCAQAKKHADGKLGQMRMAKTPDELAMLTSMFIVYNDFPHMPEQLETVLRATLESLSKSGPVKR